MFWFVAYFSFRRLDNYTNVCFKIINDTFTNREPRKIYRLGELCHKKLNHGTQRKLNPI